MRPRLAATLSLAVALAACGGASTSIISSWKAPAAGAPIAMTGETVGAMAIMRSEAARRAAEDAMVRELNARGARAVAVYSLTPATGKEAETEVRTALEKAGASGLVVMRPVSVNRDQTVVPTTTYTGPSYWGLWGGYYPYGWGMPYGGMATTTSVRVDTTVVVETLVYSVKRNQLLWAGQSRTENPANLDKLIAEVSGAVATKMTAEGMLAAQPAAK